MKDQDLPALVTAFLVSEGKDEGFVKKLYPIVLELLLHDTTRLYQALYRIDVKEDKVKNAFADNPLAEVAAERITALIMERQVEKIQWRKKYSGN